MKKALQYFLSGLILVSFISEASALKFNLNRPGLALPEGFNEGTRMTIQNILEKPECKFIAGSALNWTTTLNYGGNTESLNHFIHSLSEIDGTRISISFAESLPDNCRWQVFHSAMDQNGMKFQIRINLHDNGVDLTQLFIPEIRGTNKPTSSDLDQKPTPESLSEPEIEACI